MRPKTIYMTKPHNRYKRHALIWLIVALVFIAGCFVPAFIEFDEYGAAIAIPVLSGFFALCALIGAIVIWRVARAQDKLLNGTFLAHWTYSEAEWKAYAEEEHKTNKKEKLLLFYMVAGFSVFFGVIFLILDFESGVFVSMVLLGLIIFIGFIAWLSIYLPKWRNQKHRGEVYIGKHGVYINGQIHPWDILGAKLEDISFKDGHPAQIIFTYSSPNRYNRNINSARIPIPEGYEKEAEKVVSQISA
jgi:MFS family permease